MLQQKTTKIKSIKDEEYNNWLKELKNRFKQSQIKAAVKVNSELIRFYWSLGRDIVKMKSEAKWGSKFYDTLSKDLKEIFPNTSGFSVRNLHYMKQFYDLFSDIIILPQVGAKIGNEIMPQVGAKIGNEIMPQVGAKMENEIMPQVGAKLGNEIMPQVGAKIENELRD